MTKKSLRIISSDGKSAVSESAQGTVSRRNFLKILGATTAATAVGCADSASQKVLPYVKGEQEQNPGVAVWYSTTCTECSAGCGVRVRTREGRAVKIEGNPEHPINKGGLCAMGQASLQHLYDPDRIREPLLRTSSGSFEAATWDQALAKVKEALADSKGEKAFLTGSLTGSSKALLDSFSTASGFSQAAFEALDQIDLAKATESVFGSYGIPAYSFENADVIVSFGADFLETWVSPVEFAKGWAKGRKGDHPATFIHFEPRLSLTGSNADLWLSPKPGSELYIALAMLRFLLQKGKGKDIEPGVRNKLFALTADISLDTAVAKSGIAREKILLAAEYLGEAKQSLVLAGGAAAASSEGFELAKVTHYINYILGNVGKTIHPGTLQKPATSLDAVRTLVSTLESDNAYDVVCIYGTNPVYSLPSASRLKYALRRAGLVVSFSSHLDETARLADVILPTHTALESWGDVETRTGLYSLLQPVMSPVFNTRSFGDLLIMLGGKEIAAGAENFEAYLKNRWQEMYQSSSKKSGSFADFWRRALERGGHFADYAHASNTPAVLENSIATKNTAVRFAAAGNDKKGPVLLPYPSVKSFDGRAANKPWLQELPDPVTKIVWGIWAEMHPATAKKYKLKQGAIVRLSTPHGEVNAPVYITEYISKDVIAVPIGEGHSDYGRYAAEGAGNVLQLLPDQLEASGSVQLLSTRVAVSKGRGSEKMVVTQGSDSQMDRHLARTRFIEPGHHADHHDDHHGGHHDEVEHFYDQRKHPLYEWGLAVDLAACTGCSACVVACYAENNIPTVGKEVAYQGREMSWLRIERYYDGSAEELQVSYLPMMCQHCNNAPCEPVCPVYATYHTEEGLNAMVYNRCVGTRYCGNNCSYKVRRYNWFEFDWPEPLNWQLNPDVTKRAAGVMEKCTFCVQRINEGKDRAKDEGRLVWDGEIKPACVQSCPTEALVFGNLNDKNSQVSKLSKSDRAYKVLDHHLNTQPSVSYLENVKHKM